LTNKSCRLILVPDSTWIGSLMARWPTSLKARDDSQLIHRVIHRFGFAVALTGGLLQPIDLSGREEETFGAEHPALNDEPVARQRLPANDVAQIMGEVLQRREAAGLGVEMNEVKTPAIDLAPMRYVHTEDDPVSVLFLAKSKRLTPIDFRAGSISIRVEAVPEHGMATIWDADVLIWAASQIVEARDAGLKTSRLMAAMPYEILTFVGRGASARDYLHLKAALDRLQSTTVATSIRQPAERRRHRFSWINEWKERVDTHGRPQGLELILPDWFYAGVLDNALVLTIDRAYFHLTEGLERWLYRLMRKHGEHRDCLMRGESHANFHRDARVGDICRRAVADAMGADVRKTRSLKDALPALIVGVLRHR
jgi:hypothetical protein